VIRDAIRLYRTKPDTIGEAIEGVLDDRYDRNNGINGLKKLQRKSKLG
jgi:hypothetical protein